MAQKMPVVRQIAWVALVAQIVVIVLLAAAIYLVFAVGDFMRCIFFAALVYLLHSRIARSMLAQDHIKGIEAYHAEKFDVASTHFQASYQFFSRHPWIDRARYFVLATASPNSYRAIALCNLAFCRGQMGDGQGAKDYYEQALREFPDCVLARTSLTMIRSAEAAALHAARQA